MREKKSKWKKQVNDVGGGLQLTTTRVVFKWSCLRMLISPFRRILLICSFLLSCSCRLFLTLLESLLDTTVVSCAVNTLQSELRAQPGSPATLTCLLWVSCSLSTLSILCRVASILWISLGKFIVALIIYNFCFCKFTPKFCCTTQFSLITGGSKLSFSPIILQTAFYILKHVRDAILKTCKANGTFEFHLFL